MSKEDVNLAVKRLTGREDAEEVAQMVQDGQPMLDQMRRVLHFAILQSNEGGQQFQQAQEHRRTGGGGRWGGAAEKDYSTREEDRSIQTAAIGGSCVFRKGPGESYTCSRFTTRKFSFGSWQPLRDVASRHNHHEVILFRDLRAQAYVPSGLSSQICLNLQGTTHNVRLQEAVQKAMKYEKAVKKSLGDDKGRPTQTEQFRCTQGSIMSADQNIHQDQGHQLACFGMYTNMQITKYEF